MAENDSDKILNVKFSCPHCDKVLILKKKESSTSCSVTCPQCKKKIFLKFNTAVNPQTYTIAVPKPATPHPKEDPDAVPVNTDTARTSEPRRPSAKTTTHGGGPKEPPVVSRPAQSRANKPTVRVDVNVKPPEIGTKKPGVKKKPEAVEPCNATITRLKMFNMAAEKYQLKFGNTTIGRFDISKQSDIPIKNDLTISRQSVVISITKYPAGIEYRLTVRSATNPVKVNGKQIKEGDHVLLFTGDIFKLGNTKFRFDANEKQP